MAGRGEEEPGQREEQTKRQERADRILDAAAELLLRWGYKKTTMDDIARQAGVAKGTLYLHWKTREKLFLSLIVREKLRVGLLAQHGVNNDPDGVTLHNVIKHTLLATLCSPMFKAMITRDREMLGELVEDRYHGVDFTQQFARFYHFLTYMREQGLLRSDHSIEELLHMLQSILIGFTLADQYLPEEFQLPIEKRAELAAEAVQRAFELRNPDQEEKRHTATNYEEMLQSLQEFLQKDH